MPWHLLVARGWGSAIAEAVLTAASIPFTREEIDPSAGPGRDRLLALNPLGQIPTAILPSGAVLTESAAITLLAADLAPAAGLAPLAGDPDRAAFLRWLVFLVAAIYPTFTYGDDPARWTPAGKDELRKATDAQRIALFEQMEREVKGPWFLGDRWSAIDIYLAVMTRWRPGRAKLEAVCPKIIGIAKAMDARADLAPVWAANFDG